MSPAAARRRSGRRLPAHPGERRDAAAVPACGTADRDRRPDNAIGWLLLAIGVGWSLLAGAVAWADYGLKLHPGSLPGSRCRSRARRRALGAAARPGGGLPATAFPDGHLPGRRWRWVAIAAGSAIAAITLAIVLSPGRVDPGQFPGVENPLGIRALQPVLDYLQYAIIVLALCMIAATASLIVRFRRAGATERLQIKWLASAADADRRPVPGQPGALGDHGAQLRPTTSPPGSSSWTTSRCSASD